MKNEQSLDKKTHIIFVPSRRQVNIVINIHYIIQNSARFVFSVKINVIHLQAHFGVCVKG
jgi:hypothetical protein